MTGCMQYRSHRFTFRCSICLDAINSEKPVRTVVMCKHAFHSECLLDWIKLKEFCPNCKKEFDVKAIEKYEAALLSGVEQKVKLKNDKRS